MARYAISQEGADSLRNLANALLESASAALEASAKLQSSFSACSCGLGIYSADIHGVISHTTNAIKEHKNAIEMLARNISLKADEIEELAQLGVQLTSENGSQGFISSSAATNELNSAIDYSFETGKLKGSSDVFVKGDNFDQFFSDYYDYDNSEYISYGDSPIASTISPSSIEGIHLGASEANDPSRFWSQHEKSGTAESFAKIAAHIPEVQNQLAAGRSLSDLENDDVLGRCANIYFNPSNIPRVVKSNGYYEFESNGRHRILAARSLGLDIPVIIVGERRRK